MQTYLCEGSVDDIWSNKFHGDDALLEHHLVGGDTLWECHGLPQGDLDWDGSKELLLASNDLIVACFPARIKANHGYPMVMANHDDQVFVSYRYITDELYLVVVKK